MACGDSDCRLCHNKKNNKEKYNFSCTQAELDDTDQRVIKDDYSFLFMNKIQDLYQKSQENFRAAKHCHESNYFPASVNRFYYSILQLMLHILEQKNDLLTDAEQQKLDSHEIIKNRIVSILKISNMAEAKTFPGDFRSIKIRRNNADYKNTSFDKSDCIEIEKMVCSMKLYLHKLLNGVPK